VVESAVGSEVATARAALGGSCRVSFSDSSLAGPGRAGPGRPWSNPPHAAEPRHPGCNRRPGPQVEAEVVAARRYADASRAASTRDLYRRDIARFEAWCRARGLESLPASTAAVATTWRAAPRRGCSLPLSEGS
jgi:hypothetical protein